MTSLKPDTWERLQDLFAEAIEHDGAARDAFVEEACGSDDRLRGQLGKLLADFEPSARELEQSPGQRTTLGHLFEGSLFGSTDQTLPRQVGQYTIKNVIASGGMGTVYEAEQENPRRTVALKVIRRAIVSRSALRRFEYESRLLARLRHPGIAQVYEAGVHGDGSDSVPYFAMEYIPDAHAITDFAAAKKLGTRERLKLFTQVCDAVEHGHAKGVIHRDLKPGNLLVDADGRVKVIDFGVARSTDTDIAVTTMRTDIGQLIGTLQYMSPEQCAADPHDIDTRSDVYALGVVLYELLTDQLPYDVSSRSLPEATRMIHEEMPTRPSTINPQLRGDVETIVVTALEKDRERRYGSTAALGADIHRFLAGEAISAHPPSFLYQLRVFTRRNKAAVTAIGAVFLALIIGFVGTTTGLVRATREAQTSQATLKFLDGMLRTVDPSENRGRKVEVRSLLDEASRKLDAGELADQPEAAADVRTTVGRTYMSLGLYDEAQQHLETALRLREKLSPDDAMLAACLNCLAQAVHLKGDLKRAEPLYRRTLALRRVQFGNTHADVAETLSSLAKLLRQKGDYDDAESQARLALDIARTAHGPQHAAVATAMYELADVLRWTGKGEEAEQLCRQSLAMRRELHQGDNHPDVADSMGLLAFMLARPEAEQLCRETLAIRRRLLGDDHPQVALSLLNLGGNLRFSGKFQESEKALAECVNIYQAALGDDAWETGRARSWLGFTRRELGHYEEAEHELHEAHRVLTAALKEDHLGLQHNYTWLLVLYEMWDQPGRRTPWLAEVEPKLRRLAEQFEQQPNDARRATIYHSRLGLCLTLMHYYEQAEQELLAAHRVTDAAKNRWVAQWTIKRIIKLYEKWGKPEKLAIWQAKLVEVAGDGR